METIWIDAMEFKNPGQWRRETQFVRSVGQGYLMAIKKPGVPVENADTQFSTGESATYRVFVRTKNWKFPEAPGRFTLAVDGVELPNVLGKMPTQKWYWEIAGDVRLEKGKHTLAAIDKTGWLARFASVVITNDMDFTPSPDLDRMLRQRAEIKGVSLEPEELHFDFVVVGAGPSGVPTAIEAARNGLKVALISGRPAIGGNASDEGTVGLDGAASRNKGAWEGGIANEIRNLHNIKDLSWQAAMEQLCEREKNLTVFTNELCIDADAQNGHIISATTVNIETLAKKKFYADLFCDCSGDGWLGYYAGAAYRVGREAKWQYNESLAPDVPDTLSMSGCLCDNQENMPCMRTFTAVCTDKKVPFTAPDWAIKLPEGDAVHRRVSGLGYAEWWMENSNDFDDLWDDEFARDEMVRLGLGYFHWLKNSAPLKPELAEKVDYYELQGIALHNSKRENRRLIGDYVFNESDCVADRSYPDTVSYCGWSIDLHHPRGIYSGAEGEFYSNKTLPCCPLPYRIIYSKNIDNLFIGGRCCSVSHVGLGTVRVESTIATLGQAAGAAAYLCRKYNTNPRGIYEKHIKELQQLLLRHDLTIPGVKNEDEGDFARSADVTADSVADDVYINAFGAKDSWVPLDCEILSGTSGDSTEYAPEFYKAELKNDTGKDITLRAYLWDNADGIEDGKAPDMIDSCDVTVKAHSEGYADLPFCAKPKSKAFAVSFEPNANVLWRKRIWVKKSFATYYKQDGKFVKQQDQGMELLFNSKTGIKQDCSPANVIDGVNRPSLTELHGWVSARELPAGITLTLKEEKEISEVRITTQVDLSYPQYCFQKKTLSTGTAQDVTVSVLCDGKWKEVAHIKDNCFKQIVARFDRQKAAAVKVTVNKSINSAAAYITEVRIYK